MLAASTVFTSGEGGLADTAGCCGAGSLARALCNGWAADETVRSPLTASVAVGITSGEEPWVLSASSTDLQP